MRSFFICLLLLFCLGANGDMLNCLREVGSGYFDLTALSSNRDIVIANISDNVILQFNICRFAIKQCNSKFTFANLFSTANSSECIRLTNTTKYEGIEYNLINPDKVSEGLQMVFTGGDLITSTIDGWSPVSEEDRDAATNQTYSFAINFKCNKDVSTYSQTGWSFDNSTYTYYVDIDTSSGCPMLTLDEVSKFISDNKIVFTVVGSVLSVILAIFGLKLFIPTLFIAGFISGFFVALFTFFSVVLTPDSSTASKWILVVFAVVLGVALGYITVKANKFGIFVIGAWFGVIISLILYNAVLYKIPANPPELTLWITLGILGVGGGLLALFFYQHVVIISTSLMGSYGFVRSLSLVIGYFPNELQLIQEIQLQDYDLVTHWPFYVYMNVIFLFTLVCICIQYRLKRRSEASEVDFDTDYFKKIDV